MARNRSSLVPFTLTETLALLFFVLALVLTREARQRAEAEAKVEEHQELIQAVAPLTPAAERELARRLVSQQRDFPRDFQELVRGLDQQGRTRERLRSRLAEAGVSEAFTDTASLSQLVDTAMAMHERTSRELQMLRAAVGEGRDSTLQTLTDRIAALRGSNADLRGQIEYFRARVGNGLDHPPCWPDAEGRPEYAFRVTLRDYHVDVEPIWPEARRDDARRVDGMLELAGAGLTLAEFERLAAPVFRWSQRQDPECRYFVQIVDRVRAGKEAFKQGLLTVETYFYKYLVN